MKRTRKFPALLLWISILLLLGGCWSSVELNSRSSVRIMLIDKTDDGYKLTLGLPLTNRLIAGNVGGGGTKGDPYTYVSKTDPNLGEAYRKIQTDLTRRLSLGQMRNVVIGKRMAEEGIGPLLEFSSREAKFHINANLFVSEAEASKFTTIPVVFEQFPGQILTAYTNSPYTPHITIKDLLIAHYQGGDFMVPKLVFGHLGVEDDKGKKNWMGLNGAAIFREEKWVRSFTNNESKSALWIINQAEKQEFAVPSPTDHQKINFIVYQSKSNIKPVRKGNQLSFQINVKAQLDVLASYSKIDLQDNHQLSLMEQTIEQTLQKNMDQAIKKSKASRSDALRLGQYVEWRYPQLWNKLRPTWSEEYADHVEVHPKVKISIRRIGALKQSVNQNQNEKSPMEAPK